MTTATRIGYNVHKSNVVATSDIVSLNDTSSIVLGTSNDLTFHHDGTNTTIACNTGDFIIDDTDVVGDSIKFRLGTDTAATDFQVQNNTGTSLMTINGLGTITIPTASTFFENGSGEVKTCTYNAAGGLAAPTAVQILDGYVYNGTSGGAVALTIPAATAMATALSDRGITATAGMVCGEIIVAEVGGVAAITATATAFVEKDT